ncbi:oxygenase MpaB family protein [Nocardia cyriacigeorgica]|uniref:oxygenase MpaB family protein n=1 Tax=Nocardia cyriacigeorgica TaxID=135487 RepID=UPI0024559455|nr:oxygenase MpaB family protein [Nocardia cyriacigeorgica]
MRDNKLMSGDFYATARRLQTEGEQTAVAFFADVEHVPAWADFDAMRPGAEMGRRNPIGLIMGMHGALPATYTDPATARVMGSTGRLEKGGVDFRRRFWETASGFVGALDVDGMKPGGPRWEQWVRIRLLHTMIRLGILRSGRWDLSESMPISQLATAAATHLFGPYRVEIIRSFGGIATRDEEDSFALMWRWISRIEGANTELLGTTADEQFAISKRIHRFLYRPDADSIALTQSMIDGMNTMRAFPLPRRGHQAVLRRIGTAEMVKTMGDDDFADGLGVAPDPIAERLLSVAAVGLRGLNQITRIPLVQRAASEHGQVFLDYVVTRGLERRDAQYRPTPVSHDPDSTKGANAGRKSA